MNGPQSTQNYAAFLAGLQAGVGNQNVQMLGNSGLNAQARYSSRRRVVPPSAPIAIPPSPNKMLPVKEVQTHIVPDILFRPTCKECGMSYSKTDEQDIASHERFHKTEVDKIPTMRPAALPIVHKEVSYGKEIVYTAFHYGSLPEKLRESVDEALALSYRHMGGCLPSQDQLSSTIEQQIDPSASEKAGDQALLPLPRYMIFLAHHKKQVIGVLIVEHVTSGVEYTKPLDASINQSPLPDARAHPAVMMVDRIWVHPSRRREGIASMLMSVARHKFLHAPGAVVKMKHVMFSQTTPDGANFAKRYMGDTFSGLGFDFLIERENGEQKHDYSVDYVEVITEHDTTAMTNEEVAEWRENEKKF